MVVLKAWAKRALAGALTSALLHTLITPAPSPWSGGGANKRVLEALQSLARFRTRDSKLIGRRSCFTAPGRFLRHFPAFHSLRCEDGVGQRGRCCVWGECLRVSGVVLSRRWIETDNGTRLASQHFLAIPGSGFENSPLRSRRRDGELVEVSRVGVLSPS